MKNPLSNLKRRVSNMSCKMIKGIGDVIFNKEKRVVLGMLIVGLGGSMIISGYVPMPKIKE